MTHVSKQKLKDAVRRKLEHDFLSLVVEADSRKRHKVFGELLTSTERLMLAKRLAVIILLSRQVPAYRIGRVLKMSPVTVSRFTHAVERELYPETVRWARSKAGGTVLRYIANVLMVPLDVPYKRRGRIRHR